ncbi:MAG: hypothetical protein GEV06_19825 [Luteitalea sp.]|nr:hypothetical protein [Luteitalea sp.]
MDLGQQTTATFDTPDGEPQTVPTILLTEPEASLLVRYRNWLRRHHLSRELVCGDCGPQVPLEAFIEPHQIGLKCPHRFLFHQGLTRASFELRDVPEPSPLSIGVAHVEMPNRDALLLREYQQFLSRHGLQEVLWCDACEAREDAPGIRAFVTPGEIVVECRCTRRRHKGLTI